MSYNPPYYPPAEKKQSAAYKLFEKYKKAQKDIEEKDLKIVQTEAAYVMDVMEKVVSAGKLSYRAWLCLQTPGQPIDSRISNLHPKTVQELTKEAFIITTNSGKVIDVAIFNFDDENIR